MNLTLSCIKYLELTSFTSVVVPAMIRSSTYSAIMIKLLSVCLQKIQFSFCVHLKFLLCNDFWMSSYHARGDCLKLYKALLSLRRLYGVSIWTPCGISMYTSSINLKKGGFYIHLLKIEIKLHRKCKKKSKWRQTGNWTISFVKIFSIDLFKTSSNESCFVFNCFPIYVMFWSK